ncbi:MAG: hypothetical protein DRQ58_09265 [Gammaproteobacteria bacterium]|nr:MAG: hypothetical protein DRQ58_09265 [Gammaproteobacteria bacterium]
MINIIRVPPNMVEIIWDKARPLLQKCEDAMAEKDRVDPDTYRKQLMAGVDHQMMLVSEGADCIAVAILRLTYEDNGDRIIEIVSLAGDRLGEWAEPFHHVTREIALAENCTKIVTYTIRKGWSKVLSTFGYKEGLTPHTLDLGEY